MFLTGYEGTPAPCANVLGLQRILSLLPGKVNVKYQEQINNVFSRIITGDLSLIKNIRSNAVSKEPVNVLFRDAMARRIDSDYKSTTKDSILPVEYVYAMESEAFPGLLKIGRTKNLDQRMRGCNTFSAPKPFKLVASTPTMDSKRDEKVTHNFFQKKHEAGEFYRVSIAEVRDFFDQHINPLFETEKEQYIPPEKGSPAWLELFGISTSSEENQAVRTLKRKREADDDTLGEITERKLKLRREELEIHKMELENKKLELENQKLALEVEAMKISNAEKMKEVYIKLTPKHRLEERERVMFSEYLVNECFPASFLNYVPREDEEVE